jgi:RimJ/RimL family protein N-acetyltransferase
MGSAFRLPHPPLAAQGILLRPLAEDDCDWLVAVCSDPELGQYMPVLPVPYTVEDATRFLAYSAEGWAAGTHAPFMITDEASGRRLGVIELHRRGERLASVGYWLERSSRGRGAATIALKLIAGWAMSDLGVCRLEVTADPSNEPSQRVAERAGFARHGLLRGYLQVGDARLDRVLFSFPPEEQSDADPRGATSRKRR